MILQTAYEFIIAILIGLTQGITEFLPISSTAHMRIVAGLLANNRDIGQASGNFIQLGTVVAVVYYFREDLIDFVKRLLVLVRSHNQRIAFWNTVTSWIKGDMSEISETSHTQYIDITMAQLVIGTVPIAVLGFLLKDIAKEIRDYYSIAAFLVFGSGLMAFSEYINNIISSARKITTRFYSLPEVILIGFFQTLAIFPGVSRSGATLAGTLMLGHSRPNAVRFSFLLSLPAVILAGLLSIYDLRKDFRAGALNFLPNSSPYSDTEIQLSVVALVVAVIVSGLSGYACLRWLLKYLSTNTFRPFIIYRLALVVFLIGLMLLGLGR